MLGAFSKLGALDEMVVKFASPSLECPLLTPILPLIKHETKVILMYVYHKAEEGEGFN
jgi:hypothetical protein